MFDRRSALRTLALASAALALAACTDSSASEVKLQRYVVGVTGMT